MNERQARVQFCTQTTDLSHFALVAVLTKHYSFLRLIISDIQEYHFGFASTTVG